MWRQILSAYVLRGRTWKPGQPAPCYRYDVAHALLPLVRLRSYLLLTRIPLPKQHASYEVARTRLADMLHIWVWRTGRHGENGHVGRSCDEQRPAMLPWLARLLRCIYMI